MGIGDIGPVKQPRVWFYAGLLLVTLGFLWYIHWTGLREGRAEAEEARLEEQQSALVKQRHTALEALQQAKAQQTKGDSSALVAEARQVHAKAKVRVVARDTLRVTTDTGTVTIPVPVEVTDLFAADSARISALATQVQQRDTTAARATSLTATDSALLSVQDTLITTEKHKPQGKAKVIVVTTVVVLAAAKVALWVFGR